MSSAIDFAVRSSAGGTQYGQVAGPDQSTFIQTAAGDSLSLNLGQSSVIGYTRDGADLVIELADGRVITLADWFHADAIVPNRLYLSTDGTITEVALTDAGDGFLSASFIPADIGGKWSPLDGLVFYDQDPIVALAGTGQDDPAGMGIFIPGLLGAGGAGLGTAALVGGGVVAASTLLGGGGDGGGTGGGKGGTGGGGTTTPTYTRGVDGVGSSTTITSNTSNPAITVTGTGVPGDTVTVTIGNQQQTTTVNGNGTWTAGFSGPTLPADGTHTATATFTGNGSNATLSGPGYIIDLTPPDLRATTGFQSNGDVENLAEYADGVTLKGTTEPGATVNVTLGIPGAPGAITRPATVAANGTWEITFTPQEIPGGERSQTVTVTAADPLGNTRTITESVVLDTIPPPLALNGVAGDNVVNRAESLQPIVLTGTATPNTSVTVTIEGIPGTVTRTANANGVWSHELPANSFPDGTYSRQVTVTTRDAADNPTTVTRSINIDTQMSVALDPAPFAIDNVVNLTDSQGALTLTGTAPRDATRVEVQWLGQPVPATLNGDGTWSIRFPAGTATASQNSTLTVTAWDAAGNSATATRPIRIDLETAMTLTPEPVGADRILSGPEQRAGFTVGGTGEAGAQVFLSLNGTNYGPVPVSDTGAWTHTFTSANLNGLAHGSQATLSAYSVDAAGNRSATETRSFAVDTQVGNFTFDAPDLRGSVNDGPRDASVLNAVERGQGLLVTGSVEPGASVTLAWGNGKTHEIPGSQTTNGTWSYRIPGADLPEGANASATITATARDTLGNTAQAQQTVAIDTVVANFNAADIRLGTGTDNILNAREHAAGLRVEGKAEVGSTINVTLGNHIHTATANADGDWSVNFTSNQIPTGERTGIPISVTAVDTAGNTSGPFEKTFAVDTIAPSTPDVIAAEDVGTGLRALTTAPSTDLYTFQRIDPTGPATPLAARETYDSFMNEERFQFLNNQTVPDGSYLVINTADAAGNTANTLFINDTNSATTTVDLGREGLQGVDLAAIDLTRVPDARLTITEQQLLSVTGPDNTLLIKGDSDDEISLVNAVKVEDNRMINGNAFDIYTLGTSGARIIIEDDISLRQI